MLLRILSLVYLIHTSHSGPVTKIEEYSNDLTEAENIGDDSVYQNDRHSPYLDSNDFDDFDGPKIYDDIAVLEEVARPSLIRKRMAQIDVKSSNAANARDLISYVSRNMATEIPDMNLTDNANDLQKIVGTVLKLYGEYFEKSSGVKPADEETDEQLGIMGDQPMNDDGGFKKISVPTFDEQPTVQNPVTSSSEKPIAVTTREDALNKIIRSSPNEDIKGNRTKEMYKNAFKQQFLAHISRPDRPIPSFPNLTIPFPKQSMFNASDSPYTEKIRSFYPTCDIPKNTKEVWKEENLLNLFFNVDYNQNATIATATLRLHRLPRENQTDSYLNSDICPENSYFEDEKLLRVSIYWYMKPSKKHSKVKRRLCDSKVINENAHWVELSVKAATKTWTKSGKNMGLAISVEDQDGGTLKASKYFKGATCTLPQDLYQLSLLTQQTKPTIQQEFSRFLELTRRDPFLVTLACYPR